MRRPAASLLSIAAALALLAASTAFAQETAIRKALAERIPKMPAIDEVTRTPIAGLWEVRYGGTEILYSDDKGDFIMIGGALVDTKTRVDLTEQRIEKLTAIDFAKLPLKDALTIRQGSGARRIAVFVDPNCGYCKRFERDLTTIKDVTIYTFLMPILGADSAAKSRDIWCAKDGAQAWRKWMLEGVPAAAAGPKCDVAAIERNLELGRRHRITGTPAIVFEDGSRKPGALPPDMLEKLIVAASRKS